jgi:hypothetical protein
MALLWPKQAIIAYLIGFIQYSVQKIARMSKVGGFIQYRGGDWLEGRFSG